ncbi:MAG TPA: TIGR00730 family Rossman fold protein [Caulobacteraceae bacterium]|jgi:hypothetical protein|nr:TIGR00730 family Rossman fold protein [Caulobacteraceae bacterium]
MRAIGVYCASTIGTSAQFQDAARAAGAALARRGVELVYGGGRFGLMGLVADAALAAGGRVVGVMTRGLVEREIAHPGLDRMEVVETMHQRKARMEQLADGFVALPGGPGTMEEMFEQWTCGILGIHAKPCGFLDVGGYFDPLRAMVAKMQDAGYLRPDHAAMLAFEPDMEALLARFAAYVPPALKYVDDKPASTAAA